MYADADISPCGVYRYRLIRRWGLEAPMVFVMLNPSTATATEGDPTIARCMGFAKREEAGGIVVVNLFGLRATDPKELADAADPFGPQNAPYVLHELQRGHRIVAAWGGHPFAKKKGVQKHASVFKKYPMLCFGTTKTGQPKHPLYLPKDAPLIPWSPPE